MVLYIEKSYNFSRNHKKRPCYWHIIDDPTIATKQNISFHYGFLLRWSKSTLPKLSTDNAEVNEVEEVQWMSLEQARQLHLAFNHNERLEDILITHQEKFHEIQLA